jgi:hypothetical protein
MFEQENAFYKAHRDMLRKKYLGKNIVIVGDKVIGVYDDLDAAVDETTKTHAMGTFCVKEIPVDSRWDNWEITSVLFARDKEPCVLFI